MPLWDKFKGHPLHPAVVHFPLAFLFVVPVLQLWHIKYNDVFSAQTAIFLLKAGLVMSLPAMIAGGWDFYRLIVQTNRKDVYGAASAHIMSMLTGLLFYGGALFAKDAAAFIPLILSLCGAAVLAIGGFIGGTLVYSSGVGMRRS